ncbi:MAG: ATP-binding cassette domain-containing protein, partial [Gemmobacter sp.]
MTPQAGSSALCSVEDLSVRLAGGARPAPPPPPRTLVDGISLRIDAGDYFALVGESGSGKSMTCHSIMRLLPQGLTASGRILFEGRDILGLRPSEMAAFRRAK